MDLRNLKRLRQMSGLVQHELASETRIDRARISEIENLHVEPRPSELMALMKAIRAAHRRQVQEFERLARTEADA